MDIKYFITLTIILLTFCSCDESKNLVDRPNVIIVLTDDQGYGDFSCYGYNTPQI